MAAAVVQTGPVALEALPDHYALMDLTWHPSTHDGLPNAVLESLACGKLAIGARVGGIPDILESRQALGDRPHVTAALNIVLTAYRNEA